MSLIVDHLIRQLASDPVIRGVLEPIALALELIGVAIIVYGAIVTAVFLVRKEKESVRQAGLSQYRIKQQFTTRILTGLEFFIAGDVIKTIINPTLESLAVVGAIVAIRAALTYLLNRELKDEREREKQSGSDEKDAEPKGKESAGAGRKGKSHAEGA